MSADISGQPQWKEVLFQQRLANAERWLTLLEQSENLSALVLDDYDNLLRTLETILATPQTFDLAYRLIQALYPVAFGYADWERWAVYLREAYHLSQELNLQREQGRLAEQMGDILYHTGDMIGAEKAFRESEEIYQSLNDLANHAAILSKLAGIYEGQGKTAEAITLCQEALHMAESVGDHLQVAHINLTLSQVYRRVWQWDLGLQAAQTALTLYQQLNKPEFVVKTLLNLVALETETQKWEEVDHYSSQLMEMLLASGDVHTLSRLKNNLGVMAYKQGNYKTAELLWQESLMLHTQIQEPGEIAGLYNNLGMVYTKMGEWDTSEEMLQEAITVYRKLGDIYNWANSLDNLADLYEAKGDIAMCCQILIEAIAGLKTADTTPPRHQLLSAMSERLHRLKGK